MSHRLADIPQAVLELAESLNTFMPLPPGDERIERPGWVISLVAGGEHPALSVVQRFSLAADEMDAAVVEIRRILTERGRKVSTWEVGPSARPAGLVKRLLALGLRRYEEPVAAGMVLRQPLRPMATVVVARRVTDVDDAASALGVLSTVFAERSETPAERRSRAERELTDDSSALFLGLLDGVAVAAAKSIYTPVGVVLGGAATIEAARGHGAYRALISARYDDALRRGTPTLVVQAGAMSRPILERLGFETVAEIQLLVDRA